MTKFIENADPADHTVDEVTAYLAKADADTITVVKSLEAAGKARKGILDYVPSASDVRPDEDGYTRIPVPEAEAYVAGEPVDLEPQGEDVTEPV